RDVVVDYDYVTVTDVVTVTAGAEPTSSSVAVAADASPSSSSSRHWGHHSWHSASPPASSAAPAPSSYQAPSSSAAPSTSEAPSSSAAPTTPSSTYVAPSPTSTYVAPTTTSEAPSSTWAASSSSAAPTSSAPATTYSDIVVLHHNLHRYNHSAPNIGWDGDLASTAASIASNCIYAHNVTASGGGYGQNIAAGVEANNISAIITDLFYNGEVGWYDGLYGQAQPDMTNFEHWGHFSQIVWKSTTKVGCATQYCPNGLANVGSDVSPYFTVCNYGPPGNYANEYGSNVLSGLQEPTVQWNQGL
ncbi:hypothetical protein B0A55_10926, partial [Friedmanniomyces simplex]